MAKGVKKIKWTGQGKVISNLSVPNKKAAISPSEYVFFEVDQWYDGTPETDKKKNITWIFQDYKARTIILQKTLPINRAYGIKLPKNLCGQYEYYLEASLSGKRDLINQTGLKISGYCPPRIESSKWCTTNDGDDVRQSHIFSYGEITYLNLVTEGLNGHKNLRIDIFRHLDLKTDKLLRSIAGVEVIDGEINLQISNTYSWYFDVKNPIAKELFYVKVYDPVSKTYIVDDKNDTEHARFLRMKRDVVSQQIKPPTNLSPLKTGEPAKSTERFEPCKFETITIVEEKKENGKTTKEKTLLFDNGDKVKGQSLKKEPLNKTILFEFDKYEITSEAKTTLDNTLQFLLEHQFSSIKIDGHACVIGKEDYNQTLSQQRSDAVKKIFVDGGLDVKRITSIGRGEVNPTDNKQGRDNIKYRDEKEYVENRCVNISFDYYGHDANTIVYKTITSSHNKNITIDVTGYENKACFREKGKHQKNIKINSPEYSKAIDQVTNKLDFPIKSNLASLNPAPIQYIWPASSAPSLYDINIHSCRYFSNNNTTTVQVMAYPDIKWKFNFYVNLSNALSIKWQKLHESKHAELREKALKLANEEKGKYTEVDCGFSLEANFDKDENGKYQKTPDLTFKYTDKIKSLFSVISSIKKVSQGITTTTKGKLSSGIGRKLPFDITLNAPAVFFGSEWEADLNNNHSEIGTKLKFFLEAKPLVELTLVVDLLSLAVQAGVAVVTAGSGNALALEVFNMVRSWAKKVMKLKTLS
ncbi:OmpA family protein [Flavobacterium sp. MMS24-S5]|uniref:OmpA family protein n=1 Tax=Flavobacterium sp. MMS24-S5 TaxID=3416605 RepID=UPI003D055ADC